ncbi:8544_t:CDS:2, partial [Gigaspora rosea]
WLDNHGKLWLDKPYQHSAYLRKELTAMRKSLKPIDIVVLKKLSEVVNVVPIIAKFDSLTIEDIKQMIPFAIVGSEKNVVIDGKSVLENEQHCEFVHLREFLTRTHLQDLIETTAQIHYKAFRSKQVLALKESMENEQHCEFVHLREFLTRTHLQDLIETTAQIHYEAFRSKQLLALKESTPKSLIFPRIPVQPLSKTERESGRAWVVP